MNYCPKCGFEVRNMKYCPKCGFELQDKTSESPGEMKNNGAILAGEEVSDTEQEQRFVFEDYRADLIGPKADHYLPIFDGMNEKDHASWNWCAFLFGPIWFAYRKLYSWAAITFFAQIAVGFIFGFINFSASSVLARLCGLILAAIFAQRANYELKKRIDRLILEMPADEKGRRSYSKTKGGTSVLGLIGAIVIILAVYAIFMMLIVGAGTY